MKLFHLSDLHIGLRLMNYDLSQDQRYIMHEITVMAGKEKPDAIVIAGDIYDKAVPSAEAVELFDHFVNGLTDAVPDAEIMMISGNHDSAPRLNMFRNVLKNQNIHMIGMPPEKEEDFIEKVVLSDDYGKVNFYLLPFVKPSMVKQIVGTDMKGNNLSYDETIHRLIDREEIDSSERNVLVSHQFYLPSGADPDKDRMDSEIRTVGNIDQVNADILKIFDYAALGHIHKPGKAGGDRWRYSGTPLACSVSEAGQEKGVVMVEIREKGDVEVSILPLIPLRQVKVLSGSLEEVLRQGSDDYTTVILTDREEMTGVDIQDRLRHVFPNLLEIRRETTRLADYYMEYSPEEELGAFELCNTFLKDLDEKEQALLQDIINSVREVD